MATQGRYSQPVRSIAWVVPFEKEMVMLPSLRIFYYNGHSFKLLGLAVSSTVASRIES